MPGMPAMSMGIHKNPIRSPGFMRVPCYGQECVSEPTHCTWRYPQAHEPELHSLTALVNTLPVAHDDVPSM